METCSLDSICVICCSSSAYRQITFPEDKNHSRKGLLHVDKNFIQFLEELEGRSTRSRGHGGAVNFDKEGFLKLFNEDKDKRVTVCEECLLLVDEVVEIRGKTREVERRVVELQEEIVRELRCLKEGMEGFYGKMRKIEEKLKKRSDERSFLEGLGLMKKMEGRLGARKRRKALEVGGDEDDQDKNDLIRFRERIVEVVADLGSFRDELDKKTINRKIEKRSTRSQRSSKRKRQVEVKKEEDNIYYENDEEDDDPFIKFCETELRSYSDDDQDFSPVPGDNDREDDNSDSNVESEFTPKKSQEKSRSKRSKTSSKALVPVNWRRKTHSQLLNIDFSGMSEFEKGAIQNIVGRMVRYPAKDKPSDEVDLLDLPVEIRFPIIYDNTSQKITISDIEVIMKDPLMQCTLCDFLTEPVDSNKSHLSVESIYNHMAGTHLNAFQCHQCPKQLPNKRKFKEHLRQTHANPGSCICDICGKPFGKPESVEIHKWLHLNEEERQEAIRNGKVPRGIQTKMKRKEEETSQDPLGCSVCGKVFPNRHYLLRHEQRHLGEDNVVCPKCGKTMKRKSYQIYHMKYSCPLGKYEQNAKKFNCLECEKSFQSKMSLQIHVVRFHSKDAAERPHLCQICGKGYKTEADLKVHGKIHSKLKLWKCEKCGKEFNVKRNLARHKCPKDKEIEVLIK